MLATETDTLSAWVNWTTVIANITAVVAVIAGGIAATLAGKKYFREKRHERLAQLYAYANALFRAELTVQHQQKNGGAPATASLVDARNQLKNWYFDNKFLFDDDDHLRPLIDRTDDEAANFVKNGQMDSMMQLRKHIERELDDSP